MSCLQSLLSSSGKPYKTAKGYSPAWTSEVFFCVVPPRHLIILSLFQVTWLAADALDPSSYMHLLPKCTAVVHTLGTLFDDLRYKAALKEGNFGAFSSSVLANVLGFRMGNKNPIEKSNYDLLNRDSGMES